MKSEADGKCEIEFNEQTGRYDVRLCGVFVFTDVRRQVCVDFVATCEERRADHEHFVKLHGLEELKQFDANVKDFVAGVEEAVREQDEALAL